MTTPSDNAYTPKYLFELFYRHCIPCIGIIHDADDADTQTKKYRKSDFYNSMASMFSIPAMKSNFSKYTLPEGTRYQAFGDSLNVLIKYDDVHNIFSSKDELMGSIKRETLGVIVNLIQKEIEENYTDVSADLPKIDENNPLKSFLLLLKHAYDYTLCNNLLHNSNEKEAHNKQKAAPEAHALSSFSSNDGSEMNKVTIVCNEQRKQKSQVSRWLPDAEVAKEEQSEFLDFSFSECVREIMRDDSSVLGISSIKGAGKTYCLQMLRRSLKDRGFAVIPRFEDTEGHEKLSEDNNWGTEKVKFMNHNAFKDLKDINIFVALWKTAILCTVLTNVRNSKSRSRLLSTRLLNNYKGRLHRLIYFLLDQNYNARLESIINNILKEDSWKSIVQDHYIELQNLCIRALRNWKEHDERLPIAIFIDKIDQSLILPNAETPDCTSCHKISIKDNCIHELKDSEYCYSKDDGGCKNKDCCYKCEIYSDEYAGAGLRVYNNRRGMRYEHISHWQYIQIALVVAADDLINEFQANIRVYYTVRQEAFSAEHNLLGENTQKIFKHKTKTLYYSKEEHERIYVDTIKNQHDEYLLFPELKNANGRYDESFVGVSSISHPHIKGAKETLFDSIFRHSFDRARDVQNFGAALEKGLPKLRSIKDSASLIEDEVKRVIESHAADSLYTPLKPEVTDDSYFAEKKMFLSNYWQNPDNFVNLLRKIDRNLLFVDEMVPICKELNGNRPDCDFTRCGDLGCALHPFSMLDQLGLLGKVSSNINNYTNNEQSFRNSSQVAYFREESLLFAYERTVYILHPALTKCIEKNIRGGSHIMHFKKFILGKSLPAPNDILKEMFADKKTMGCLDFIKKYYTYYDSM